VSFEIALGPSDRTPTVRRLTKTLVRFLKRDDGPTAVEYAVMLALVIAVCVSAITTIGTKTSSSYTSTGNKYPVGS
jgi:pilus assembly protein Flp/PilA